MAQTLTDAEYDGLAERFIRGEAASVSELAREKGIGEDVLQSYARDHSWHKLHAEYREAKLRKPINDLLVAPIRVERANGHSPAIQIDLAQPMLAYHASADKLRLMIEKAQQDWDEADGAEDRGKVEVRLDRLLERQRIMLRIPSPGRDSGAQKTIEAPPAAREI